MSTPFLLHMAASDNTNPKDYYKVLEVEYDATDEIIKLNYRRLALKWHPDKHGGDSAVTTKFQEINEAYNVLSDHAKRLDYDLTGICEIEKYSLQEYLARFKGMILTCNGLGIDQTDRCALKYSIQRGTAYGEFRRRVSYSFGFSHATMS